MANLFQHFRKHCRFQLIIGEIFDRVLVDIHVKGEIYQPSFSPTMHLRNVAPRDLENTHVSMDT